jgi:hypothetical protein
MLLPPASVVPMVGRKSKLIVIVLDQVLMIVLIILGHGV